MTPRFARRPCPSLSRKPSKPRSGEPAARSTPRARTMLVVARDTVHRDRKIPNAATAGNPCRRSVDRTYPPSDDFMRTGVGDGLGVRILQQFLLPGRDAVRDPGSVGDGAVLPGGDDRTGAATPA